jgi:hypothetical protein
LPVRGQRHKTIGQWLEHMFSFMKYPVPCTLYPVPCTLHPAPCTLYPVPCTLYPVPCTLEGPPVAPPSGSTLGLLRNAPSPLLGPKSQPAARFGSAALPPLPPQPHQPYGRSPSPGAGPQLGAWEPELPAYKCWGSWRGSWRESWKGWTRALWPARLLCC